MLPIGGGHQRGLSICHHGGCAWYIVGSRVRACLYATVCVYVHGMCVCGGVGSSDGETRQALTSRVLYQVGSIGGYFKVYEDETGDQTLPCH